MSVQKPIEATDPIINNAQAAVQQLAFAMGNAIALFEVIESTLFEQIVPDNSDAGRLHGALMIGIETLRQHTNVAHCIADTMGKAA